MVSNHIIADLGCETFVEYLAGLDLFLSACHSVEYLNFAIVWGDISTKEMSTQGNLLAGKDTNLHLFQWQINPK